MGGKTLTAKERMAIPRAKMPEQNPAARAANFEEVPFGLTPEQAMLARAGITREVSFWREGFIIMMRKIYKMNNKIGISHLVKCAFK